MSLVVTSGINNNSENVAGGDGYSTLQHLSPLRGINKALY